MTIGARLRFEVLKRDNFQCSYCGARAPDVLLEVDHILAKANGGGDDFLNLVTSCQPCNRGKSSVPLDDHQALGRQIAEIERIEAQAASLDELRQRKADADELLQMQIDAVNEALTAHTDRILSEAGRASVKRWLQAESVEALMTAVEEAAKSYVRLPMSDRDWRNFFAKIPAVAAFRRKHGEKSEAFRKALYAAGIMRNRLSQGNFAEYSDGGFQDIYEEMFSFLPPAACEEMANEMVKAAKTYPHYPLLEEDLHRAMNTLREKPRG